MSFFTSEFEHLAEKNYTVELGCSLAKKSSVNPDEFGLTIYNLPFSRTPISVNNIKAYKQLKKLVKEKHYDIVHCHTPNAAAITRLACKGIRKKGTKVVYTAHGFHFYKGASRKNWMIYYPVEWVCAHWCDTIITINSEDYELAKKKLKAKKVEYIPGVGIDLNKFGNTAINIKEKRKELGIPEDAVVLLSVGELNKNKNHETVLRAIEGMDVYYLIAGKGDKEEKLFEIAKEVGMQERVKLLGYRRDVDELLIASDIFVFPSFREGLSVSLMETMASGRPAVVSQIRGNNDLIDKNGGALFNPYSVSECKVAIQTVINSDREKMGRYNKEKVKKFSLDIVLRKIDEIYGE